MTYNMIPYQATFYQFRWTILFLVIIDLVPLYHSSITHCEQDKFLDFEFFCQMYRGSLADGSLVAIRCLKLKKKQASINFKNQIDIISKLRHRHLTSALGHCFEYYLDDSTVSRIFFIFEFAPKGNLRSNISRKLNSISHLS